MTSLLKDARERSGIAIEEVAQRLKIRRQYLIAIEEEKLEQIPGEVYAQGYMKMYATYLGIDPHACKIFNSDSSASFWSPDSRRLSYFGTKKITISLLILGILCIFCWYSLFEKVNFDSDSLLINKLNEYNISEEDGEELTMNPALIDTALSGIPNEGNN